MSRSASGLRRFLESQGGGPGCDLGSPLRLLERLQVEHSLLLHLERGGEARHVQPVLQIM